jgi:hypothetical protein
MKYEAGVQTAEPERSITQSCRILAHSEFGALSIAFEAH